MTLVLKRVALEGVGRFREPRSFELCPGASLLLGPNEAGKTTLLELIAALLDPDPELETAALLSSVPRRGPTRAELWLAGDSGTYVVRADLAARSLQWRADPGVSSTDPLSGEAARALRARLGFARRGDYKLLFTASGELVSSLARAGHAEDSQAAVQGGAVGRAVRAARLEADTLALQLELARERVARVAEREREAEQLVSLERAQRAALARQWELVALEEELERAAPLAEAREQLAGWAEDFEAREAELQRQHRLLAARRRTLKRMRRELAQGYPVRGLVLLAGLALGAGGALLWSMSPLLASLAIVAGVAVAGTGAVLGVRTWWHQRGLERARSEAIDRARMLTRRFELETSDARQLAAAVGVASPRELPEAWQSFQALSEKRERLRAAQAQAGDPQQLAREVELLRVQLRRAPAPDAAPSASELASLAARCEAAEREAAAGELAARRSLERKNGEQVGLGGRMLELLLDAAHSLVGREAARLWSEAQPIAGSYLRALSAGRYAAVYRKSEGGFLLEREGRPPVALEDLSGTAAEILHHAVQFALIERVALQVALPVLLDDPFVRLDPQRRSGAARALRRLSAVTQLVHASTDPSFESCAEQVVRI